jgi:hypothetical protein
VGLVEADGWEEGGSRPPGGAGRRTGGNGGGALVTVGHSGFGRKVAHGGGVGPWPLAAWQHEVVEAVGRREIAPGHDDDDELQASRSA